MFRVPTYTPAGVPTPVRSIFRLRLSLRRPLCVPMPRLWEKSFRSAPAGPNGLVWVNDVKVTGTPVVTWPSNWAEAMLWPRPSVKAVVEEEKLAYRLSEVRDVSTQVVVMTTGDEPTAEAP